MSHFREIVVAMDFSEHAERAFALAVELAKLSGGRLHLVHAYLELPQQLLARNLWIGDDVWDRLKNEDAVKLEAFRERAAEAGVETEVHQTKVQPSEAIAAHAKTLGADLIVMGTRGLSGIAHVLLGSVAERTLRVAPCPVLAVPGA